MNDLQLNNDQNSIYFDTNIGTNYGVSNGFYFYITKSKKEADVLFFSIVSNGEQLVRALGQLELKFTINVLENGSINLDYDYVFLEDDELLEEINKITSVFNEYSISQYCEISNQTAYVSLYNLTTRFGIISNEIFEQRFQHIKISKRSKYFARFFWSLLGSIVIWQVIGYFSYPYVLGNIKLYSSSFSYSSDPQIVVWSFSIVSTCLISYYFAHLVKKKILYFLNIPICFFLAFASVYIMDGISIHRAFHIDISLFSILGNTSTLYSETGLSEFLDNNLLSAGVMAILFSVLFNVLMIKIEKKYGIEK